MNYSTPVSRLCLVGVDDYSKLSQPWWVTTQNWRRFDEIRSASRALDVEVAGAD